MSASIVITLPALLFASFMSWFDPSEDTFIGASGPPLDLVSLDVSVEPTDLVLTLGFDPSTDPADLFHLSGYIDFDTDFSTATGQEGSHLEEFDENPSPEMGVDYYVTFWPDTGFAELTHVADGVANTIGFFETTQSDLSVSVTIPRCHNDAEDGICVGSAFRVVGIIGNLDRPTDRIPNGEFPLTEGVGDFDHDGLIDASDVSHLRSCQSGPGVPFSGDCSDADLDGDGDVDQDDFGILQQHYTGS